MSTWITSSSLLVQVSQKLWLWTTCFLTDFNCTYQPPTKNVLRLYRVSLCQSMPILAMHLIGNSTCLRERYRITMVLLLLLKPTRVIVSDEIHESYRKNFKYWDMYVWAKSVDSDQTALKEQSDQDLHCLPFFLHLLEALLHCKIKLFYIKDNYGSWSGCPNI